MKKILSLVLTFIIILSAFCALPVSATTANSSKPKETTYLASNNVFSNANGKVYVEENKTVNEWSTRLVSKTPDGKTKILENAKFDAPQYSFYIRGKTVYYSLVDADNADSEYSGLFSVNLDGTNKKKIAEKDFNDDKILGGYGDTILLYGGRAVINGSINKIYTSRQGYYEKLFNGKIYYANSVYDLDTKKVSTFKKRNSVKYPTKNPYVTNKYMYYLNTSNNLVQMDTDNKQKVIVKNVEGILGGNSNQHVIYTKKDKKGVMTVYRHNKFGKDYPVISYNAINNFLKQKYGIGKTNIMATSAVFVGDKICITVKGNVGGVLTMNMNGTNIKCIHYFDESLNEDGGYYSFGTLASLGKEVYYTLSGWYEGLYVSYLIKTA